MKTEIKFVAPVNLNTRNVSILEDVWRKVPSSVYVSKDLSEGSRRVSGFSKLGMLSLCIEIGDTFYVTIINSNPATLEEDKKVVVNSIKFLNRG